MTPLSLANPEEFARFIQTAEILKVNTEDIKEDLSKIGYDTNDISKAVQNITNNNATATNITFGNLYFECNGVTSAEVMNDVSTALQREFEGLANNAYQRAKKH